MNGDRNLLLGVLAHQMDFIGRDTLVDGLHGWMRDKARPLGELLRDQGRLTAAQLQALNLMVEQHVLAHQGDAQRSLAAVPASSRLKQDLRNLREPALEPALVSLGAQADDTDLEATAAEPSAANGQKCRYQILRPHAKGGLGEVFVALDEELNREVALKEIQHEHADVAPSRARFLLEAEITGVPEGKKSRRREIAAGLGDVLLFCTRDRLVNVGGAYGLQPVKHGVATITAGTRFVLGVPFHEYR